MRAGIWKRQPISCAAEKEWVCFFFCSCQFLSAGLQSLPETGDCRNMLGGKTAYMPSHYTNLIFFASIFVGVCAGLITGCIGAGGGFIIAPALMSAGVKGILAVGTDLFHIFAKAIMGSVLHRKLGNISVSLAGTFLIGSIAGATHGRYVEQISL